jgi:hypothetical protein
MSTATPKQFGDLLIKALTDPKFCQYLVASPAEAAKAQSIYLDSDDVASLSKAFTSLLRFAKTPNLDPQDASIWSLGAVELLGIVPTPTFKWNDVLMSWTQKFKPLPMPAPPGN